MPIIRRLNEGLPPYFLVKKKVLSQIVYNNPTYSRPRSAVICARTAASVHSGAAKEEFGYQRGDLMGMPELCITIGMKQILASWKIYIALNRPWQHGPLKHVLLDLERPQWPATLLRRVKDLQYCMTRYDQRHRQRDRD